MLKKLSPSLLLFVLIVGMYTRRPRHIVHRLDTSASDDGDSNGQP